MHQVIFQVEGADSDVMYSAPPGSTLLDAARAANVAIDAPCSGNESCGKCRVKLISGELEVRSTTHISERELQEGWRLACASVPVEDVVVFVPDIASAYRSRMKTADLSSGEEMRIFERLQQDIKFAGIEFGSVAHDFIVQLDPPSLDDTMPDDERLTRAIADRFDGGKVEIVHGAMRELSRTLAESGFHVRIAADPDGRVLRVMPETNTSPLCAAAIDIGTTTVAAVLVDLKDGALLAKCSSGNGQIRYGADVINRIIEQGRSGGIARLQNAVIKETIDPLLRELCREAGVPRPNVIRVCAAGNTTMEHLFVGVHADRVRLEPYIPAFFAWRGLRASDVALPIHPAAPIVLAPNIGSYVGGDITAGVFTTPLWRSPEFSLFIDLGTNGEIVFGNSDLMMACACSAGPAFEGGEISCGMRATDGAIEKCTIDAETMEPTFSTIGASGQRPVGICGSGIIDIVSELYSCGIISAKGLFKREGRRILTDEHGMKRYVLAFPKESATGREVSLNEVDLDCFIRAKGSIFSAIDTMLAALDMDVSVIENVYVAGGIGSGIDMANAVNIGMFPDVGLDKFRYVGNSSLAGVYAMAISKDAERRVFELARTMTYMELSTEPSYMDRFIGACFLPHTQGDLFPSSSVRWSA